MDARRTRLISSRLHGVLDYGTGLLLLALPRLLGWSELVTMLLTIMAVATVVYSLLTAYELGVARVIPMGNHLFLDVMSGSVLLIAALLMTGEPAGVRMALAGLGVFELVVSGLTDPQTTTSTRSSDSGVRVRMPRGL